MYVNHLEKKHTAALDVLAGTGKDFTVSFACEVPKFDEIQLIDHLVSHLLAQLSICRYRLL